MARQLPISLKLIALYLVCSLSLIAGLAFLGYQGQKQTLEKEAKAKLSAMRETKKRQIENHLKRVRLQMLTLAEDYSIIAAAKELKAAFHSVKKELQPTADQMFGYKQAVTNYYKNEMLRKLNANVSQERKLDPYMPADDESIILQYFYIASNPNPTGSKNNLDMASDGSTYSTIHGRYHPLLHNFLKRFHYYDIFIVDPESGHIVYTVFKEVDFSTTLLTGPHKDTNLATAFKEALAAANKEMVAFADFEPYDPSYAVPAAFVAVPIFDGDRKVAVLASQLPIEDINSIMTDDKRWEEIGLGKTGEVYLVGKDFKMRSIARRFAEDPQGYLKILGEHGLEKQAVDQIRIYNTTILLQKVHTEAAKDIFRGNPGIVTSESYMGTKDKMMSAYAPLDSTDVKWGIIAEMSQNEIHKPVYDLSKKLLLWGLVLLLLLLFIIFMYLRRLVSPVNTMITQFDTLSTTEHMNLSQSLSVQANDEIGVLGGALNAVLDRLQKVVRSIVELFNGMTEVLKDLMNTVSAIAEQGKDLKGRSAHIATATDQAVQELRQASELRKQAQTTLANANNNLRSIVTTFGTTEQFEQRLVSLVGDASKGSQDILNESMKAKDAQQELVTASARLVRTTEESKMAAADAVRRMQDIIDKTKSVYDGSRLITTVVSAIKRASSQTHSIAINAHITAEAIGGASDTFLGVANDIKEFAEQIANTAQDAVKQLGDVDPTGKLTPAIKNIDHMIIDMKSVAERISMLAVSSTVRETAMGDPIKSFTAVAAEVRSIADEISHVAQQSEEQLEELKVNAKDGFRAARDADESIHALAKLHDALVAGIDTTSKMAADRLHTIELLVEHMRELSNRATEMTTVNAAVVKNIDKVKQGITDVKTLSEEAEKVQQQTGEKLAVTDTRTNELVNNIKETVVLFDRIAGDLTHVNEVSQKIKTSTEKLGEILKNFVA